MEQTFTKEQRLLHQVVLHANDVTNRGLFYGQMGIVLVLSEYARSRKLRPLKTAVNFILNQVLDNLSTDMPLDFANGLTGIGWGVEYLLQNKFQRGQGADICAAIDQKLMQQNILRQKDLGLQKGMEGWLHYIVAHLQGAQGDNRQVFDEAYLRDCAQVCQHLLQQGNRSRLCDLCNTFLTIIQGGSIRYTFNLPEFISPSVRRDKEILGMHKGLAGQLFTLI